MIDIEFLTDSEGKIKEFQIQGHASASERSLFIMLLRLLKIKRYGNIVCASVSVLSMTTVNNLERLAGIEVDNSAVCEDGYLHFVLPQNINQIQSEISQILLISLYEGLKEIENEYPEYITINEFNELDSEEVE